MATCRIRFYVLLALLTSPVLCAEPSMGPVEQALEHYYADPDRQSVESALEAYYADPERQATDGGLPLLLSLETQARHGNTREKRAWLFGLCLVQHSLQHFDAVLAAAAELEALATTAHDDASQGYALLCRAIVARDKNDIEAAYPLALRAYDIARKTSDNPLLQYRTGVYFGEIAHQKNQLDEALAGYRLELQGAEALDDARRQANALQSVATVHAEMGQHAEALDVLDRAEHLMPTTGHQLLHMQIDRDRGFALIELGKIEEAQASYRRALAQVKTLEAAGVNVAGEQTLILVNLADLALRRHQYTEAEQLASEAKVQATQDQDAAGVAAAESNIGHALAGQHRIELAYPHILAALTYAREQKNTVDEAKTQEEWSRALADNGRFQEALEAHKEYTRLRNLAADSEREHIVLELQQQMGVEKKDREIQLLAKEKALQLSELDNRRLQQQMLLVLILALGGGALFLVLAFLRVRNAKRAVDAANSELVLKRAEVEQLNTRLETVLLDMLPAPIAHRLVSGEQGIADLFPDVTVLFSDIVNFTQLSRTMSPHDLVALLNEVFSIFDDIAERHCVEKIKTIGDAYLAASGFPEQSLQHIESIADMALAMVAAIKQLSAQKHYSISIRIGINTGPLVAGVIGKRRYMYDLWGDTVNLASRMETSAPAEAIQVSESTYARLVDRYLLVPRGQIDVKGHHTQNTYLLIGKKKQDSGNDRNGEI